jgi:starch-binding outer membrane protein, SusD/RagB family
MHNTIFKIATILVIGLFLSACADLEEHPIGVLTPESYFQSEEDVKAFVLGLYNTPTALGAYGENLILEILSDEYDVDPSNFRPYRYAFNEYNFSPNDYRGDNNYFVAYTQITGANMLLQRIDEVDINEEIKNSYKAEALFVRSIVYFYLVRMFGDVPYYEKPMPDPNDGGSITRTTAEIIYQNIIRDLKFGVEHLPDSYAGDVRNRATKGTALSLLAKIHLTLATYNDIYEGAYEYRSIDQGLIASLTGDYASHWEAAAEHALQVINNKGNYGYELVDDFQDLFNGEIGDTKEHIFSLDFYSEAKGGETSGGIEGWRNNNNGLVPIRKPWDVGGWNAIVPPMSFYEFFIDGDYRRDVSFETTFAVTTAPVGGDTTQTIHYSALVESGLKNPFCAKWTRYPGPCEQWPSGIASSHNIPIFRYGEILLIAAEALNEIGRTSEAIPLMNELRARARVAGGENRELPEDIPSGLSQAECWEAIWTERQYELAFEWKRWFDLVRRDSLQAVMSRFVPVKTGTPNGSNVKEHHILLPIVQSEIDKAPNYAQNKGY